VNGLVAGSTKTLQFNWKPGSIGSHTLKILLDATNQLNESDESNNVLEDLRKLDAVEEVYLARGAYDLIAKVSGASIDYLREEVLKQIRNLSSIKSTLTLTVV
jgi:DNA-binding Lrp family transcriptional regulator